MILALAASLAIAPVAPPPAVDTTPRVSSPAPSPAERAPAPAAAQALAGIVAERPTPVRRGPSRLLWDGKNRTAGDRAHKRLKRRRAAGRAK